MTLPESVLTLLEATGFRIHDGKVPKDPALPYVVVYFGETPPEATSLEGTADLFEQTWQTSTVGETAEQIRLVRTAIRAALLDARPTATGLTSGRVRLTTALPAREDRDLAPSVLVAVDRWAATNVPA